MEAWYAYERIKINIDLVENFSGGNQECIIFFSDKQKKKYKLHFEPIFDFRYAIENAFLDRCAKRPWVGSALKDTSIYVVKDSEYLKYFEKQSEGVFPMDGIRHFILFDAVDTGIEILASYDPVLVEL